MLLLLSNMQPMLSITHSLRLRLQPLVGQVPVLVALVLVNKFKLPPQVLAMVLLPLKRKEVVNSRALHLEVSKLQSKTSKLQLWSHPTGTIGSLVERTGMHRRMELGWMALREMLARQWFRLAATWENADHVHPRALLIRMGNASRCDCEYVGKCR